MIIENFMGILCERDNRIHGLYSTWAKSKGINYNILTVLCSVYNHNGCTQRYICDEWCLAKQTVNTTCKELVNAGLLLMEQNKIDKRETNLALTEKGYAFITPIVNELYDIEKRIYDVLGHDKVSTLIKLYTEYAELTIKEFEKQNKEIL